MAGALLPPFVLWAQNNNGVAGRKHGRPNALKTLTSITPPAKRMRESKIKEIFRTIETVRINLSIKPR
jgi:hypothetical protein